MCHCSLPPPHYLNPSLPALADWPCLEWVYHRILLKRRAILSLCSCLLRCIPRFRYFWFSSVSFLSLNPSMDCFCYFWKSSERCVFVPSMCNFDLQSFSFPCLTPFACDLFLADSVIVKSVSSLKSLTAPEQPNFLMAFKNETSNARKTISHAYQNY